MALFSLSILLLAYTLVGYPWLMRVLARLRPCPAEQDAHLLPISVILCMRDEHAHIATRLENLLRMEYPADLLEIIVVSDGSNDGSDAIVQEFSARNVRLVRLDSPGGKAAALNAGIAAASHEHLLLCDARQCFASDVAMKLIAYFADETVGAVSGRLVIQPSEQTAAAAGVGDYWNMEVRLRADESACGSVVGATGAIYMIRKSLAPQLTPGTILDDVYIPMHIVLQGRRVLYDATALAYDTKPVHDKGELTRKVRTLYGNLQLWKLAPAFFHPRRNPIWWRFVSHKLLRLLLPWLFLTCLVSSLAGSGWLFVFGLVQLAGWGTAALAWRSGASRFPFKALATLLLLNTAVVLAWWRFFTGGEALWATASSHDVALGSKGDSP